ncbi:MAG TPA: glycosyltransferase [Thermomicrobiales bacterium]|nr:glycosyltransferase [Thermomicrobiales bacterium]
MTLRVSVVVPTFNRPDLLDRCLNALVNQEMEPWSFEIVVADDAASEATCHRVEHWAGAACERGTFVCYVRTCGRRGPAAARNTGWRAARGEIIAFTDDDCVPLPGWLAAGLSAFTGTVAAVDGRVVMPLPAEPTDYEKNAAGLEQAEFVTANCFYRRDVLDAVGGFDEQFRAAWREDSDLFFRVLDLKQPVGHAPDAIVIHPIRPGRWGVSIGQQQKTIYNALLYRKHPERYRERIQAAPPWRYYRIVGALATAFGAGLLGRRRTSLVAAGVWAVMTGRFCVERIAETSRRPAHVAEMIVTSAIIPPLAVYWRIRGAIRYRVLFV